MVPGITFFCTTPPGLNSFSSAFPGVLPPGLVPHLDFPGGRRKAAGYRAQACPHHTVPQRALLDTTCDLRSPTHPLDGMGHPEEEVHAKAQRTQINKN